MAEKEKFFLNKLKDEFKVENSEWVEKDEYREENDKNYPAYNAFRNNIVDYIKPTWEKVDSKIIRNRDDETQIDRVEVTIQGLSNAGIWVEPEVHAKNLKNLNILDSSLDTVVARGTDNI